MAAPIFGKSVGKGCNMECSINSIYFLLNNEPRPRKSWHRKPTYAA